MFFDMSPISENMVICYFDRHTKYQVNLKTQSFSVKINEDIYNLEMK